MASHVPKWGPVETELMTKIFAPEVLRAKVPGIGDVLDGAAHLRAMHDEIGIVGEFQRANGFTKDRSMQRICKIDTNIQVMLEELHKASCGCGKTLWGSEGHKAWVYKWLEGPGKNFDTRTKVLL